MWLPLMKSILLGRDTPLPGFAPTASIVERTSLAMSDEQNHLKSFFLG